MVKNFFIVKIFNKRQILNEKTKESISVPREDFYIRLNKKNASLLVVSLAYLCRVLYYGRVEEVKFSDFFGNENF